MVKSAAEFEKKSGDMVRPHKAATPSNSHKYVHNDNFMASRSSHRMSPPLPQLSPRYTSKPFSHRTLDSDLKQLESNSIKTAKDMQSSGQSLRAFAFEMSQKTSKLKRKRIKKEAIMKSPSTHSKRSLPVLTGSS